MNRILISVFLASCFFSINNCFAQTLVYNENPEKAMSIRQKVPEGKSLLVFDSQLDLVFESSMEFLDSPQKEGNLYYLAVTPQACLITIKNPKLRILTNIPFGQLTANTLPILKSGEIRYFAVRTADKLNLFDNTEKARAAGNSDNQMLYEKEALIIITTDPSGMQLDFSGSVKITDIKHQDNRHLIYIQPTNQIITLKEKESGATAEIVIADISVKDVKYYFVSLPDYLKKNGKKPSTPDEFLALAYSDNQIGNTKNALNNLLEYAARASHRYIEPYMLLYDLLIKERGENEAIKYFEEFHKKEQSQFSQFMLSYARKDFENIKKMALNYPDFLPAKIYRIKNEVPFYKEIGYQLQAETSKTSICVVWEEAEKLQSDIQKIDQCEKSDYFLKPETIHSLITPEEKQHIEGWGLWRKRNYTGLINLYLKEIKGNSDINSKDYIMDSCVDISSECAESDRIFVGKLYDEIVKKTPNENMNMRNSSYQAIPDGLIVKQTVNDSDAAVFTQKCVVFSIYSDSELAEMEKKSRNADEWAEFYEDYSNYINVASQFLDARTKTISESNKRHLQFKMETGETITVDRAKSAGKLFFFNPQKGVRQCDSFSFDQGKYTDY